MIRALLAFLSLSALLVAPVARAGETGQLDSDPALFTVLAAINAAGYDADLNSTANHPLRQAVRQYLASRDIPCLKELKTFFEAHKRANSGAELSQYVSFALSVEGPPTFKYRFAPNELPPDVIPLVGFDELLSRFYKEADIETIWEKSQPVIDAALAAYQGPVTQGLMQVNAYLRNPTSGYLGRKFQVYIDLLGAPYQIHNRSYKDDIFIVVTPSGAMVNGAYRFEPQSEEVRHAYLHYLLDPLVMKFSEVVSKKRSLIDFAMGAPALEDSFKQDYILLVTECLIKAVETRLDRSPKRDAIIAQAMREGFILTAAFAELLPVYEKQEQAFRLYFPELVQAIDLRKEVKRLDGMQFAKERASKVVKSAPPPPPPPLTGAAKILEDADKEYRDRNLDAAKKGFLRVLESTEIHSLHARAYYGLARIAALERDPELANKLFEKTLELNPDPDVRAWSLVYLGRLADAQQDRASASQRYKSALAVEGAPDGARQAAQKGLTESFVKPKP